MEEKLLEGGRCRGTSARVADGFDRAVPCALGFAVLRQISI